MLLLSTQGGFTWGDSIFQLISFLLVIAIPLGLILFYLAVKRKKNR
ncbi:MAG TPA: hypothetical protein VNM69_06975 [Bacillus sp. (in: firmicutes)]|nr:hypothetical protein [Bacillus litorisediminis]HWO75651.1 hypothetical protein [Bacillus sp. (in: firmicutes)]